MVLWAHLSYKTVVRSTGLVLWQEPFTAGAGHTPLCPIKRSVMTGTSTQREQQGWCTGPGVPSLSHPCPLSSLWCFTQVLAATDDQCWHPRCHWGCRTGFLRFCLSFSIYHLRSCTLKNSFTHRHREQTDCCQRRRGWGTGWRGDGTEKYKLLATKQSEGCEYSVGDVTGNVVITLCCWVGAGIIGGPICKVCDCLTAMLYTWN